MANRDRLQGSVDIFVDELIGDEELRNCFFRNPLKTLERARDWGLPLSDSEISALIASGPYLFDHVADRLDANLAEAA